MRIIKILFLNIFTLFLINNLYPQGFNSIASSDGIYVLAAGNQGKIFYSTNSGNSYASYILNSTVNYNGTFASDSTFWLAGSDGNLYNTLKNSLSLNQLNLSASSLNSICFPASRIGYICGDSGKVFKTVNKGVNWNLSGSGISNVKLNSISFLDSLYGAVAGDSGKIYLTSNGGVNWILQTSVTTKNLLKIKYFQDGIIAVGEFGTILMKNNSGSWISVNSLTISDFRSIAGNSYYNIHVCGGGGFIRNNKNDSTRFLNFEKNPMFGNLKDIIYTDSATGFAVSSLNSAIIKTTNGGLGWTLTAGATISYNWVTKLTASGGIGNNLCRHPFDRNSMFVMYNNLVYVSRNKGENWSQIASVPLGSSAHSFYVSPLDTNIWLCALGSPGLVARTTNYGLNWSTVISKPFSNYGMPLEEDQNNPAVFYFAPDGGGFYKSIDTGKTFTEISSNYPFRSPCDIVVMWNNSRIIFVADGVTGSGLGQIYKSSNGGLNWNLVQTNSSSSEIPMIANTVFDQSVAYATNWPSGNIYQTKDSGNTWSLLRTNPASGWATDICREDPTAVLTGSYSSASYMSTDAGANFTSISISNGAGAGEYFVDRGYVLDMRTSGLCKLNVNYSIITSSDEHRLAGIPDKLNLHQNYPNPFNPATTIKFDIPKSGIVTLKIYDMLGREMNSLVNGFKNAGTYEITFNGNNLSSGIYFYKLQTDAQVQTKKLMLIK